MEVQQTLMSKEGQEFEVGKRRCEEINERARVFMREVKREQRKNRQSLALQGLNISHLNLSKTIRNVPEES